MRLGQRFLPMLASLGALVVIGLIVRREVFGYANGQLTSDFHTYVQAAAVVRHGGDPYTPVWTWISHYSGGILNADLYVYPPLLALLLIPFTFIPFSIAFTLWGIANVLFLTGAIICTARATGRRFPLWALFALTGLAMALSPVRFELQWGQADILLAFLISASFLAARRGHPIPAGLLLALAIVIKPPLLLLVLFFLWKREWSLSISAVSGAVVLFLAPFTILGGAALREQLAVWGFWSSRYVSFVENDSPKGVLTRLLTHTPYGPGLINAPSLVTILWIALVLLLGISALAMTSRDSLRRGDAALAEFGLAVCTLLVASPLTEWIYLTLLIIPFVLWASLVLPQHGDEGAPVSDAVNRTQRRQQGIVIALVVLYVFLAAPINDIEFHTIHLIAQGGVRGALYVLVAAIYLYPLLAAYLLSLALARQECGRSSASRLARYWRDAIARRSGNRMNSSPIV